MKIAIIEDEKIHTDYLAEYLQEWSLQRGKPVDILAFISAESFLFAWEEDRTFDILFVDIQMCVPFCCLATHFMATVAAVSFRA